jgi:hypothetical protein
MVSVYALHANPAADKQVADDCSFDTCRAGSAGCNIMCDGVFWSTPATNASNISKCKYSGNLLTVVDNEGHVFETNCAKIDTINDTACVSQGALVYPNWDNNKPHKCCGGHGIDDCDSNGKCSNDGTQICANCGDKICGKGENKINCPQDCEKFWPCAREGELIYNQDASTYSEREKPCCSGLKGISYSYFSGGLCTNASNMICTNCGDGICGKGENGCNCPSDCKKSDYCGKKYGSLPSSDEKKGCENVGGLIVGNNSNSMQYVCQCCQDSDKGKKYYSKGTVAVTVKNIENQYTDQCVGSVLQEWYCNGENIANQENYNCPNGCSDGACVYKK